jgi:hypothetical protein
MKKLDLSALTVDSFPTAPGAEQTRGTVHGNIDTTLHCPISYGGTCYITCWESCGCDTADFC